MRGIDPRNRKVVVKHIVPDFRDSAACRAAGALFGRCLGSFLGASGLGEGGKNKNRPSCMVRPSC